ncbi:adenosylhomocysteine nucleosidase [Enterococcus sp. PF1-24]|uniref:5'-methylthioadenosine/S-adenosylhomocysteine nucleosidase n=1 Tax=unclassified Enterococcus TaxID=2608891 RepID=UPI002476F2D4|nr:MULTISPECIES: 5'-methylthioadenosine/S-adenosylhomocysteine nucleosidase [unclassified Enterococcus]MDH6364125.1 adenosylhomocysteine nucleosidase [Enterococcus sp. PFB1-1]MDH6401226.1 adenosylhomocysteine nucleosidase [Enterococcus sp. PF1-24]
MKIGIVAAMELELSALLKHLTIIKTKEINQRNFYSCIYGEHQLELVCCGRGKVNATFYTSELIQHFQPEIVINLGVSGGIDESLKIFDILVGEKYCHYDVRKKQSEQHFPKQLYYFADQEFLNRTLQLNSNIKAATFGTGEAFVTEAEVKDSIATEFAVQAVDMESAAIAQCCHLKATRFISLRAICDKADAKAINTTEDLQTKASEKLADILLKLLLN